MDLEPRRADERPRIDLAGSRLQIASDSAKAPGPGALNKNTDKVAAEMPGDSYNLTRSVAFVWDVLSRSIDPDKIAFKRYVFNLVDAISKSHGIEPSKISFKLKAGEALLELESAMYCGLIINELVSEFIRHDFPDGRKGEICVEFRSLGASIYKLAVSDNGTSCIGPGDENSGIPLIQALSPLLKEIDGCIKVDGADGNRVEICFNELKYENRLRQPQVEFKRGCTRYHDPKYSDEVQYPPMKRKGMGSNEGR